MPSALIREIRTCRLAVSGQRAVPLPARLHAMDQLSARQPVLALPVGRGRLAARAIAAAHRRKPSGWSATARHQRRASRTGVTRRQSSVALARRAKGPRASVRACSYHASPGACQSNVLCIGLWMVYVNTLVNRSIAVDECCCGKVDNRCDTGSDQVAGCPRSTGRYAVSTGEPARPPLSLAIGGHEAVTAVSVAMRAVSVAMRKSRCPSTQLPLVTASRSGDWGWSRRCVWPDWYLGDYRSGHQLAATIA